MLVKGSKSMCCSFVTVRCTWYVIYNNNNNNNNNNNTLIFMDPSSSFCIYATDIFPVSFKLCYFNMNTTARLVCRLRH
jgi:hypothetical protein